MNTVKTFILAALAASALRAQAVQPDVTANVVVGSQFTITVTADSKDSTGANIPMTIQWNKDGVAIPGAVSASLVGPNAPAAASGVYTATLKNTGGTTLSPKATIVMITPVVITTQPAAQSLGLGSTATFNVAATGTGPLTYQWRKTGVPIPGAVGSSFVISAVAVSDVALYTVDVTNFAGTVTSAAASLTVITVNAPVVTGFGITKP